MYNILFLKIAPSIKNVWSEYFFFSFCTVNFCEDSIYTVNASENIVKNLTFERIFVGKYSSSKEKCEPNTVNGMCFFHFFHFLSLPKGKCKVCERYKLSRSEIRALCLKQSSGSRNINLSTQSSASNVIDMIHIPVQKLAESQFMSLKNKCLI